MTQGRDRPATKSERRIIYGFVIIATIAACTAIGHKEPPADWPKLDVSYHKVGFMELQSICGHGPLMLPLLQYFGCAWIHFDTMECRIYYASDDEYGRLAVEHELDHCNGKDHIGSSLLADAWAEFKKTREAE